MEKRAEKKPHTRRYETANGFAMDVQRYLADEPVQACPPSAWYRFRKFARRNRRALVTVSVFALAALVGLGALAVSTVLVWKANKDLKESVERERREAYFQRITVAHRELSIDNLAAALRALGECPEDLREWEWHYLMRLCKFEPLVLRDKTEVNGVAFSPDGERLASACADGSVKIWKIRNSRTGTVLQTIPPHAGEPVVSVAFPAHGKHLASRGADGNVKVWDLTAPGQPVFTEPCNTLKKFGSAYTVAFSPDGRLLAAGTGGVVKVWDWKNRQLLHSLPGHEVLLIPVAYSRDGRLATSVNREDLKLWDAKTGILLRTVDAHRGQPVSALAFSPDGEWLASASYDRTVKLSNSKTGEILRSFDLHTANVECVALSPNGRRLASAGEDKTGRVWDATPGREGPGRPGHADRGGAGALAPA